MSRKTKRIAGMALAVCLAFTMLLPSGFTAADTVWAASQGALSNGALTANADGWTVGGDYAQKGNDYDYGFNDGYLSIWNNGADAKKFSISQTVENVAEGDYYVRLAAVGNGNKGASTSKDSLTLEVSDDTAGETKSVKITTDGWDNWDNAVQTDVIRIAKGSTVTITISGGMVSGDWYGIKNVVFETDQTAEAPITVKKVDGLSEDFIHGVDVSSYLSEVQSGVKWYDENGKEKNLFAILKDAGVNYVRLRVWNCPFAVDADGNIKYVDSKGTEYTADKVEKTTKNVKGYTEYFLADGTQVYREGYGAGNIDADTAAVIGKEATKYGMKVLMDFHYSDFWADPNKHRVPKAWEGYSMEQKKDALSAYTTESLQKFKDAGVDVGMVQIGNEINNGLAGETDMANICALLKAGSEAVRAFDKNILIAVHYTDPQSEGYQLGKAKELQDAGVDYDVFATSYYPFWHGTPEALTADLKGIADTYNKKVMVAEISYAWTYGDGDGYGNIVNEGNSELALNYPVNEEGQAAAVRDAIAAVAAVGDKGIGTFYWEPAWIPVNVYDASASDAKAVYEKNAQAWNLYGSGWGSAYAQEYDPEVTSVENGGTWDNQAFFDFNGRALSSLNVYKWVYTGAEGPVRPSTVDSAACTMNYGAAPKLPETVTVNFNDGTTQEVAVTWDAAQVKKLKTADFGDYTVDGSVGAFSYTARGKTVNVASGAWKTTCSVTVSGTNYVVNGSFEDNKGDGSGWTLTNHLSGDKGSPKIDTSSSNAKTGMYYYTGWDNGSPAKIDFSIEQTISKSKLPNGTYTLFAYYQGTKVTKMTKDAGLYATVTYNNGSSKNYKAKIEIKNVWKDWYQAKVSGIKITGSVREVKVGTRLACTGEEPWVVVDDVSLMQTEKAAVSAKPATVKKPTVKNSKSRAIKVSYKKVSGATGYVITYSTSKKFTKSTTKSVVTAKLSKTITKLKKGRTYYVKVRAYKKDSKGKKTYGSYSPVRSVKIKK